MIVDDIPAKQFDFKIFKQMWSLNAIPGLKASDFNCY